MERNAPDTASQPHLLQPRPYQLEMLGESLRHNVIVAMDTGSGKTHVAVLRIQAELETCSEDQLVWFLGPKVALCEQQHNVLKGGLSSYEHRLICGADGVDKWTEQHLWDSTLANIRVVVSTPDVLWDALSHGFVRLSRIALLVFDEAHHCTKNGGMNKIMKFHYFDQKRSGANVPSILGLTASPVKKFDDRLIAEVQANLDSVIITPSLHRSELLRYSNRPLTQIHQYSLHSPHLVQSPMLCALERAFSTYDLSGDPKVIELKALCDSEGNKQLQEIIIKRKTFCLEQLKMLRLRGTELEEQLGHFAVEWYLRQCQKQLHDITQYGSETVMLDWSQHEKAHLLHILEQVTSQHQTSERRLNEQQISNKFNALLEILDCNILEDKTCIVFAKQRATVAALTELLSIHPLASNKFRVGSFVGSSANLLRKTNISDLADLKTQHTFLDAFRAGDINLIVSTDVLEEGIDVPACNLIVCFDPPQNLISFVQRRGRARQHQSQYIIMLPSHSTKVKEWETAEEVLNKIYAEEDRQVHSELQAELFDELADLELRIPSTKALVNMHNVLSHLHHFCNTLKDQYVSAVPVFSVRRESADMNAFRSASVTLPASLDPALRVAHSSRSWRSERHAKQDAALVAYRQLYEGGLINDHLLPVTGHSVDEQDEEHLDMQQALITVAPSFDPLLKIARLWQDGSAQVANHQIIFEVAGNHTSVCNIGFPAVVPKANPLRIQYTKDVAVSATIGQKEVLSEDRITPARNASQMMYHTVFRNYNIGNGLDYMAILIPDVTLDKLSQWTLDAKTQHGLLHDFQEGENLMVFDRLRNNVPHVCTGVVTAKPSKLPSSVREDILHDHTEKPTLCAKLRRLPRARNFLHPMSEEQLGSDEALRKERLVPIGFCSTNNLKFQTILPAHIMPSIMRHWTNLMIAEQLRTTILEPVGFDSNDIVLEAICASSAREKVDYQRLEFLGDCVLKVLTSLHLFSEKPRAPEAQLSRFKDDLVSNQRLAKAAIDSGLDRFIIDQPFTGDYVKPMYISEVIAESQKEKPSRTLPRKTLADVVESLVGAAYLEGCGHTAKHTVAVDIDAGLTKAIKCLSIFLAHPWRILTEIKPTALKAEMPPQHLLPFYASKTSRQHAEQINHILGHTFTHAPLLTTALTHASQNTDTALLTYDRLEFLGDALLDFLVTNYLILHHPSLPHPRLHNLRQSSVNGDFLAYLCMCRSAAVERNIVTPLAAADPDAKLEVRKTEEHHALWHFMRRDVMSYELTDALGKAANAHTTLRESIGAALHQGERYPWSDLMAIGAPKCISDIVESTLAAVWLDTTTSVNDAFVAAEALAETFGILPVLRRLAGESVECMQPVERAHVLARGERLEYAVVDATDGDESGEKDDKHIVLSSGDIEIARMPVAKVAKSEVMNESRVSYLQKCRLAEKAIREWERPGGGQETVARIQKNRSDEESATRGGTKRDFIEGEEQADAEEQGPTPNE